MFGKKEEFVLMPFFKLYNFFIKGAFLIDYVFDKRLRDLLHKNRLFMDKYEGKKCYIFGNGPSLKSVDLSGLKDEYVFSVNFFMKSDLFGLVKPNFHVMIDPIYFKKEFLGLKSDIGLIRSAFEKNNEIEFFIPYYGVDNFKLICPKCKVNVLYSNQVFLPYLLRDSSLVNSTPCFANVVLMCIYIAICMGFKKIILLGVDMNGFIGSMCENNGEKGEYGHAYDNKDIQVIKKKRYNNEFYLKTYGHVFEQFRYFSEYYDGTVVKIYNATPNSLLDNINKVDLKYL